LLGKKDSRQTLKYNIHPLFFSGIFLNRIWLKVLGLKGTRDIAFYDSVNKITANRPQLARKGLSLQINKYMAGFLLDFLVKSLNNGQKSILRRFGLCKYIWLISKGVQWIVSISKSGQSLSKSLPQMSRVVFDMDVWQTDLIQACIHIQEQTDLIQGCVSDVLGCPRRQWASRGGKPHRAISLRLHRSC